MPLVAGVSRLQHGAAGVPIHFCANFLRAAVPEHCWIRTYPVVVFCLSPSGLKLFVHGFCILVALCAVFADSLTSTCSLSLTTLDCQFFASLLSRHVSASSFSSWIK